MHRFGRWLLVGLVASFISAPWPLAAAPAALLFEDGFDHQEHGSVYRAEWQTVICGTQPAPVQDSWFPYEGNAALRMQVQTAGCSQLTYTVPDSLDQWYGMAIQPETSVTDAQPLILAQWEQAANQQDIQVPLLELTLKQGTIHLVRRQLTPTGVVALDTDTMLPVHDGPDHPGDPDSGWDAIVVHITQRGPRQHQIDVTVLGHTGLRYEFPGAVLDTGTSGPTTFKLGIATTLDLPVSLLVDAVRISAAPNGYAAVVPRAAPQPDSVDAGGH